MNTRQKLFLTFAILAALAFAGLFFTQPFFSPATVSISPTNSFHDRQISITLKSQRLFEKIYYTLDGSDPKPDSPSTMIYHSPILATPPSVTTIKARTFNAFGEGSGIAVQTFFADEKVNDRFGLPVVSLTIDPYHLYDHQTGIFVAGQTRSDFYSAHPEITPDSLGDEAPANFKWQGRESERPAHLELFLDKQPIFHQNVGLRLHGRGGRLAERKSFKLIARKSYEPGEGKFKYPLFDSYYQLAPAVGLINEFESLLIRQPRDTNLTFVRDELGAEIFRQAGFPDYQPYRPAATFLNSRYYGLTWIKPAINEAFFAHRYAAPDENFQVLELSEGSTSIFFPEYFGNQDQYYPTPDEQSALDQLNEVFRQDLTDKQNFAAVQKLIDVDNLLLYYALQASIDNLDWPHNNYKMWRYTGKNSHGNPALDGRWRYVGYDFDFAFDVHFSDAQIITHLTDPQGDRWRSVILSALLQRPDLQEKFATICADLRTSVLSPEQLQKTLDRLGSLSRQEIEYSRQAGLYQDWLNENQIKAFRDEIMDTVAYQIQIVKNFFPEKLAFAPSTYQVAVITDNAVTAKLNTQRTQDREADFRTLFGDYYSGTSVPLTWSPLPGYQISQVTVNGQPLDPQSTSLIISDALLDPETQKITVKITNQPVFTALPLQISEIVNAGQNDWLEFYNPNQHQLSLVNYCLSDDPQNLCKWQLPDEILAPETYWRIFSQDNRTAAAWRQYFFHFNLTKNETLYLSDKKSGEIFSQIKIPASSSLESFSFDPTRHSYYPTKHPTPNQANRF